MMLAALAAVALVVGLTGTFYVVNERHQGVERQANQAGMMVHPARSEQGPNYLDACYYEIRAAPSLPRPWERVGVRERSGARRHFIIRGGSARPMIVRQATAHRADAQFGEALVYSAFSG
jgi:hypothetical protein